MKIKKNTCISTLATALAMFASAGSALADYAFITAPDNTGTGWWNASPGADTRTGGTASIGVGPGGTGALGSGSLQMTSDSSIAGGGQAKAQFVTGNYVGTNLSAITALSYMDYRSSASTTSTAQRIGLNIGVDYLGDGTSFATLVFEPVYQSGGAGALVSDAWQSWDAIKGGNAKWWSSAAIPGVCAFNCYVTWNTILANNPNAKVKTILGFNIGSVLQVMLVKELIVVDGLCAL